VTVPMPLYGCENWTVIKENERKNETAEMKFFRSVAGYRLREHKTNEEIRGLNIIF
jgi:hypothetical protein